MFLSRCFRNTLLSTKNSVSSFSKLSTTAAARTYSHTHLRAIPINNTRSFLTSIFQNSSETSVETPLTETLTTLKHDAELKGKISEFAEYNDWEGLSNWLKMTESAETQQQKFDQVESIYAFALSQALKHKQEDYATEFFNSLTTFVKLQNDGKLLPKFPFTQSKLFQFWSNRKDFASTISQYQLTTQQQHTELHPALKLKTLHAFDHLNDNEGLIKALDEMDKTTNDDNKTERLVLLMLKRGMEAAMKQKNLSKFREYLNLIIQMDGSTHISVNETKVKVSKYEWGYMVALKTAIYTNDEELALELASELQQRTISAGQMLNEHALGRMFFIYSKTSNWELITKAYAELLSIKDFTMPTGEAGKKFCESVVRGFRYQNLPKEALEAFSFFKSYNDDEIITLAVLNNACGAAARLGDLQTVETLQEEYRVKGGSSLSFKYEVEAATITGDMDTALANHSKVMEDGLTQVHCFVLGILMKKLYFQRRHEDAIKLFEDFKSFPELRMTPAMWFTMTSIYTRKGEADNAIEMYRSGIQKGFVDKNGNILTFLKSEGIIV